MFWFLDFIADQPLRVAQAIIVIEVLFNPKPLL